MPIDMEKLERRCPRLGGPVPFRYCESSGEENYYCFKILDCWWEQFDIVGYLRERLTEAEFERIVRARPKPKVTSLVELIQQAKKNIDK